MEPVSPLEAEPGTGKGGGGAKIEEPDPEGSCSLLTPMEGERPPRGRRESFATNRRCSLIEKGCCFDCTDSAF